MENAISLAYRIGTEIDPMPIPPIPEHCIDVPAGPVRFVVESRDLARDLALQGRASKREPAEDAEPFNDGGASLHVFGTADGIEHLRFDCFETQPHYHYVKNATQRNHVVRIDEIAEGDPVAWTVERVRSRLPEMLEFAGAADVATQVRAESSTVAAAVEKLADLLDQAQAQRAQSR